MKLSTLNTVSVEFPYKGNLRERKVVGWEQGVNIFDCQLIYTAKILLWLRVDEYWSIKIVKFIKDYFILTRRLRKLTLPILKNIIWYFIWDGLGRGADEDYEKGSVLIMISFHEAVDMLKPPELRTWTFWSFLSDKVQTISHT